MRIYWLDKNKIKYHNTGTIAVSMQIAKGLQQCGITAIWIESVSAHKGN